jgi:hypothetical protein
VDIKDGEANPEAIPDGDAWSPEQADARNAQITPEHLASALEEPLDVLSTDLRIGSATAGGLLFGFGAASIRRKTVAAAIAAGTGFYLLYCGLSGRWCPKHLPTIRSDRKSAGSSKGSAREDGKENLQSTSEGAFPPSDPLG